MKNPFEQIILGMSGATERAIEGKGWRKESARHALARKGIKTGRKKNEGTVGNPKNQTPTRKQSVGIMYSQGARPLSKARLKKVKPDVVMKDGTKMEWTTTVVAVDDDGNTVGGIDKVFTGKNRDKKADKYYQKSLNKLSKKYHVREV